MSKGTKGRHVRVPDELWVAARERAEREGLPGGVSSVIVEALRRFVEQGEKRAANG